MCSEQMRNNEVGCNLLIETGSFHPEIVTLKTGVPYSEIVIKGEPFKTATGRIINERLNKLNLWVLKMPKIQSVVEESELVKNSIENILNLLDEEKEKFISVLLEFPSNHILCYGYFQEEVNTTFHLDKMILIRLAEYGLSIEFDFYLI